jgi:organic hydroperoxide reductase OsmC/OhrA
MMGTLATLLAGKMIPTTEDLYWAEVEGDIENVNNILKITTIRVKFHLRCPEEKWADAKKAFANHINHCPAAQSVKDCIKLEDELVFEK